VFFQRGGQRVQLLGDAIHARGVVLFVAATLDRFPQQRRLFHEIDQRIGPGHAPSLPPKLMAH